MGKRYCLLLCITDFNSCIPTVYENDVECAVEVKPYVPFEVSREVIERRPDSVFSCQGGHKETISIVGITEHRRKG